MTLTAHRLSSFLHSYAKPTRMLALNLRLFGLRLFLRKRLKFPSGVSFLMA
jgi:hypothetical protein